MKTRDYEINLTEANANFLRSLGIELEQHLFEYGYYIFTVQAEIDDIDADECFLSVYPALLSINEAFDKETTEQVIDFLKVEYPNFEKEIEAQQQQAFFNYES